MPPAIREAGVQDHKLILTNYFSDFNETNVIAAPTLP